MCANRILYLGLDTTYYQAKGEVTHWPMIKIVPRPLSDHTLQEALKLFEEYTHVIVTSKSTVGILKNYLPLLGIPLESWAAKTTLAVGHVTAKHLQACGIHSIKIAKEETAEGLIHELQQIDLNHAHFFWPHSSRARPIIKEFFKAHAIKHFSCILYDPQFHIPGQLPVLEDYDEIVFTSPSTIDAFLEIFGHFPCHCCLTPIGPITARHLELMKQKKGRPLFHFTYNKSNV